MPLRRPVGLTLRCATMGGAYLTFDENKVLLEVGKLADLAVVSADPLVTEESQHPWTPVR